MVRSTVVSIVAVCALCVSVFGQESSKLKNWVSAPYTFNYCTTAFLNISYVDDAGILQSSYEESAKYGECEEHDAFGILVHVRSPPAGARDGTEGVEDHTGCRLPFQSSRKDGQLPTEPWVALIKRGSCNFEIKVENAYRSNATAVIVYDDKVSYNLQKMKLSSANRNISAVFTYKSVGDKMAALVDNGSRVVFIGITVGSTCDRPYNLNRTSVLFVSISFIVLMVISLAWLIFYYVQRFRYIHAKDRLSRRLGTAAKKALSKIPTKNVKSEDKEVLGEGECCAVCIEPFKISEVLRILPCKHEFHKSCIDPWLLEHRTCPMCKMDILRHYGFVFTGSQESILHLDIEEGASSRVPDSRPMSPTPDVLTVVLPTAPDATPAATPDGVPTQASAATTPSDSEANIESGTMVIVKLEPQPPETPSSEDALPAILELESTAKTPQ